MRIAQVTLVEAGAHLMPAFDAKLVEHMMRRLVERGVRVRVSTVVRALERDDSGCTNVAVLQVTRTLPLPLTRTLHERGCAAGGPTSPPTPTPNPNPNVNVAVLQATADSRDGGKGEERLPFGLLVWSAGLQQVKLVQRLCSPRLHADHVRLGADCMRMSRSSLCRTSTRPPSRFRRIARGACWWMTT